MRKPAGIMVIALAVCASLAPVAALRAQTTAYFVVARPNMYPLLGDSYILPLADPDDIEFARLLAANGGGNMIVVAMVTPGSDGINRDVVAPGEPLWSWHVSRFDTFATATIELCDGNPTFTETSAQNWPPGHEEMICYWNFRVMDEIPGPTPVDGATWGAIKALFAGPPRAAWKKVTK